MATKRKHPKSKPASTPIKFSVPLPPEVHRSLALASVDTGASNSALIRDLVSERFTTKEKTGLRSLAPANPRESNWKRVSVFLPPELKHRATEEVQRQHGNTEDKRYSGSLASAIAALVAERYNPEYPF